MVLRILRKPSLIRLGRKRVPTDDVDGISGLGVRYTDQEVVRLDVTVDQGLLVDGLHTGDLR